ncbi:Uma2 family endonuclease [Anaerolineales bacterium HSG24]|nr:Uma2 family endonuclease [Anaerolineales bacterium HSG24]
MTTLTKPQTNVVLPRYALSAVLPAQSVEEEPFPYGWRTIEDIGPNGETIYRDIALTLDDFLDPQEGDQMPQGIEHSEEAIEIRNKLKKWFRHDPHMAVLFDVKMKWGILGLQEPFPDIAVIPKVKDKHALKGGHFDVLAQGTRPCLIVEITSPNYEAGDRKKVQIYERAQVEEYLIINPYRKPFELQGYRLEQGQYRKLATGRFLSRTTNLRFEPSVDGGQLIITDTRTDEVMLSSVEEIQARKIAETRAEQEAKARKIAEARAEQAEQAKTVEMASKMLAKGSDPVFVAEITGLSLLEVVAMRRKEK